LHVQAAIDYLLPNSICLCCSAWEDKLLQRILDVSNTEWLDPRYSKWLLHWMW
jgi:hypothetical protein